MKINGNTRIVGLFGYPVKHTASPAFHNAAFEELGLDWVYLPLEVKPEELRQAVEGIKALGFVGVNCTIPHKETVMELLDEISKEAGAIGAVNTIHVSGGKLVGHNTDGTGFMRSLTEIDTEGVRGKMVFIMGTGGAGRAVAVQCALEGVAKLSLCDKDEQRAEKLAGHIQHKVGFASVELIHFDAPKIADAVAGADVFVDATPLGMHEGDPMSIDLESLDPGALVVDLVYKPPQTPLLIAAGKRGCRTLNGLGMLLHQGAKAFEIWTGLGAPVDVMRRALEKAVYMAKTN